MLLEIRMLIRGRAESEKGRICNQTTGATMDGKTAVAALKGRKN